MQRGLGEVGNGLQQGPRHVGADDGGGLEQALLRGGQAIDMPRQHRLHRGGHLQAVEGCAEMRGARRPDQHPAFDQRPYALLQKEWIAVGALDQQRREGREARVGTQQSL